MSKTIAVVATLDTKGNEAAFISDQIRSARLTPLVIDAGVQGRAKIKADFTQTQVAKAGGASLKKLVAGNDRGVAVAAMADGVEKIIRVKVI